MTDNNIILGRLGKDAVRKAVMGHQEWPRYAADNDVTGKPSKEQMLDFADHTDIDVLGVVAAAYEAAGETPPAQPGDAPAPRRAASAKAPAKADKADADEADEAPAPATGGDVSAPVALDALADRALAGAADWLSDKVLGDMRGGVTDALADAFNAGAASVVPATPTVAGAAMPVFNRAAPAMPGKVKTLGEAFGIRGKHAARKVTTWTAADAPAKDAAYHFNADLLATVTAKLERGGNVWLYGPRATGKTTFAAQVAAHLGRPFVRLSVDAYTEPADWRGSRDMAQGTTYWTDGAFVAAIRRAGCLILVDEPTLNARIAAFLQTALDERFVTIPETGEVVRFAPGVVVIVGDNTAGSGDMTGQYGGTYEQNTAFLSRFKVFVPVDYMAPADEARVLAARLGVKVKDARPFADFAAKVRKAPECGEPLDHRALVAWMEECLDGTDDALAFELAVQNKMRPAFGDVARQMWNAHFAGKGHEGALRGEAPAPATIDGALTDADLADAASVLETN